MFFPLPPVWLCETVAFHKLGMGKEESQDRKAKCMLSEEMNKGKEPDPNVFDFPSLTVWPWR